MRYRPCKDCPKRHVGCQSECEDYKRYKREYEAVKKFLAPTPGDLYISEQKRKKK